MSENYNLNSSFGFNISSRNAQNAQTHKLSISESSRDVFASMFNHDDKYESVLNGDIQKEIGMYSRQAMFTAMNLKSSDNNIRKFDINI